jgi:Fe-S-cluster containining protein
VSFAPFAPVLRPEVALVPGEDGAPGWLHDPVLDRRVHLGPRTAALVARLDGRPWDAVAAELAAELAPAPADREALDRILRKLLLLDLVVGAGAGTVARMAAARRGEPLPRTTLAGARFACQGSGACCREHRLGPLTDDDLARLAAPDVAAAFPDLGPPPYHQQRDRDGEPAPYLRTVADRCLFLGDDHRCRLHARLGAAAKPAVCRAFPVEELATVAGLRIYDRGACARFATSARRGDSLLDQTPGSSPAPGVYHPLVRLDDGLLVDYGHYLDFTAGMMALLERGDSRAPAALSSIAAALADLRASLATCPLAPGQPEATVAAVVARAARLPDAIGDAQARDAADHFTLVLADIIESLAENRPRDTGATLVARALDLYRLGYRLSARAVDPRYPLTADEEAILAVRGLDDPEVDEVLRLSLRQQLFGYRSLVADRPFPALARMALLQLAAIWGARRRAAHRGAARFHADDLSEGHSLAARSLDVAASSQVLVQHEDLLASALAAMPWLAGE